MVIKSSQDDSVENSIDKDLEIQSVHGEDYDGEETDIEEGEEKYPARNDIEAQHDGNGLGSQTKVEGKGKGSGLANVLSRISTRTSIKDPGPPPDGGMVGWTQGA